MRALAIAVLLVACQQAPEPGWLCTRQFECASPLVCANGRCRDTCSANRDCAAGQLCVLGTPSAGTCTLASDTCDATCGGVGAGLSCVGGRCLETCASNGDCPSDGHCESGACRAGPALDAGVRDGS